MTRSTPRRIAVIGGGANDEHDISTASAAAVTRALRAAGHDPVPMTVGRDGRWSWHDHRSWTPSEAVGALTACDAAFPLLHGAHGEDGSVAGLLDLIGVPHVGSPVRAGAIAADKWVMKLLADALGIATAPAELLDAALPAEDTVRTVALAPPLVVKPTSAGSSNGVSVVRRRDELPAAVRRARAAGRTVLAESFVSGREVDVAVFRDRTGTLRTGAPLEVEIGSGSVFDRTQKYDGSARFRIPADVAPDRSVALSAVSETLYDALGCVGVARFDFFVTDDGVLLNEVNTTPGFTEQSQVPRMFAAVGLGFVGLVDEVVASVLEPLHSDMAEDAGDGTP
ncbi:D-alanine--D-alanine ligase [Curtobacterium sp. 9128]|uniref:D-alanine--D-alanine ligase family protein n=1 Tax=Curtobacterium sp. 9128 TaxID=1793722 RepID=UPI00119FB0BF|nr:D-alanine--D-alanine ligase [Curtobacterium sp. 9128]